VRKILFASPGGEVLLFAQRLEGHEGGTKDFFMKLRLLKNGGLLSAFDSLCGER